MSIYATLWCLKFPRYGEYHFGCEWIEVVAQGVPAHIGSAILDPGYANGDPYAVFLPPAITVLPENDERAMRVAHGEGRGAEEIVALDLLAFERDFVVHLGEVAAGVDDAGHVVAALHDDGAILDLDFTFAAEVGRLPAVERLAIEERLPLRLVGLALDVAGTGRRRAK